jgi:triosephosphate isomerase
MVVAGNWKMHMLIREARELATQVKNKLSNLPPSVKVILCPPFTALAEVASVVGGTHVMLGAQNVHWEEKGAYTGEISPPMLKDAGCAYVIIGHSERRQYFGETDEIVNKKAHAVLKTGLKPIICVGETEEQRGRGETESIIVRQVRDGLNGLTADQLSHAIIAYEPVWAIGTGKNATPEQAQEVHALIRRLIKEKFGASAASALPIQYGGSVKPENALDLFARPDINGGLIGGASLKVDSFEKIVRAGAAALK